MGVHGFGHALPMDLWTYAPMDWYNRLIFIGLR